MLPKEKKGLLIANHARKIRLSAFPRPSLHRGIYKQKSLSFHSSFLFKSGGEGGIRTLDTFSRIHTFQACSLSLSDTSPCFFAAVTLFDIVAATGRYYREKHYKRQHSSNTFLWFYD